MSSLSNEIYKDIDISVSKLKNASDGANSIQTKLEKIDGLLLDSRWTGESNLKCQDLNKLLLQYNEKVALVLEELHKTVDELDKKAQNYDTTSNTV